MGQSLLSISHGAAAGIMSTNKLNRLTIEGFKSIRELHNFELRQRNILIGGNGAGKSNFVEMFRLLRAMVDKNLAEYIIRRGKADDFLFNGPKYTPEINAHFIFGKNEYRFKLVPTANDRFSIKLEEQKFDFANWQVIGSNIYESKLADEKDKPGKLGGSSIASYIYHAIKSWTLYHFHDTSLFAPMRRSGTIKNNKQLFEDAANIAAFLLYLKNEHSKNYREIVNAISLVTPFFDDFILEPVQKGEGIEVSLDWKQKGSDYTMQAYQFSDGTIRFICLATVLLQPELPAIILIDEPELGLHPYAIAILAELIRAASEKTQVIISTQSPTLIDYFEPEDIVVVSRDKGASTFKRLNVEELSTWLEEYTLGDLWRKNIIAGGPVHE